MGILGNYFLRTKEEKLKNFKYESLKEDRNGIFATYQEYLPLIKKCYEEDLYWHGTGRYHYEYDMNSREKEADQGNVFDVLESIIDRKAILAHRDLFLNFENQTAKTISLTPCRMYARCYAEIHQYELDPLKYEYGSVSFWISVIVPIQLVAVLRNNPVRVYGPHIKKIIGNIKGFKKIRGWISTFRKDSREKKFSLLNIDKIRSDIEGNHGILIAFKKEMIKTTPFDKGMERFEARACGDIPFDALSHMEVPVANLEEIKNFLGSKKIMIPVIPIEYGERYCNNYRLPYLIGEEVVKSENGITKIVTDVVSRIAGLFSGNWGQNAAGILIYCPGTGEILLLKRSGFTFNSGKWSVPGGAKRESETFLLAAKREAAEEMQGLPCGTVREEPYIYKKKNFTYQTFILDISVEERGIFSPRLNWENTDYKWFKKAKSGMLIFTQGFMSC